MAEDSNNTGTRQEQELSFEAALQRLEALVQKMEEGRLPLEELTRGFEEGKKLATLCRSRLNSLTRKIEILLRDDGGDGVWSDFDTGDAAPPAGSRRNANIQENNMEDTLL